MTRRESAAGPEDAAAAAAGAGSDALISCPGDGGGGGTSGLAVVDVGVMAGVAMLGVGVETYRGAGVPTPPDGADSRTAGVADVAPIASYGSGVAPRTEALLIGVIEPSVILMIAPQTLHRARTPFGGTFAGSTRNTDRQS